MDVLDDLEPLVDIYKVTACLFRFYTNNEKQFVFDLDRNDMDVLNKAVVNTKGTGGAVLGFPLVPLRQEERQYAIFLSWVLEELLCEQEGLEAGDE